MDDAKPARILIVAGSDSGGGAGIQADIKTVTMLGGYAMTAVTAITAQNTVGVQAAHPVQTEMVIAQIDSVIGDIGVDAIKIGMIGSAATAEAVADRLEGLDVPIVFDPVMVATSGSVLADADTIKAFERLMRLASLVTPNLPELEALGGEVNLLSKCKALLVKGGHAEGETVEDRLVVPTGEYRYFGDRIATSSTHGTGCTLASAIAVGLGDGKSLDIAVDRAVAFTRASILHAPGLGQGSGPLGHAQGRVPYYDALVATDPQGWEVAAFAARWA